MMAQKQRWVTLLVLAGIKAVVVCTRAAVTKYRRLGGYTTGSSFPTILESGVRIGVW